MASFGEASGPEQESSRPVRCDSYGIPLGDPNCPECGGTGFVAIDTCVGRCECMPPFLVQEEGSGRLRHGSLLIDGRMDGAPISPEQAEYRHQEAARIAKRHEADLQDASGEPRSDVERDAPLKWIHDSWIDECEAAQVYSRKSPVFGYLEQPVISVALTRAELWTLAQRHLNTVLMYREFVEWTGMCEDIYHARSSIHGTRFWELYEQLPPEDQQRFAKQIEMRQRYIDSVAAEVSRCEKKENEFWERVKAGLVSEAEVAAHKTPPFILGLPVMPSPADGGRGPEEWGMFSSRENPLMPPR